MDGIGLPSEKIRTIYRTGSNDIELGGIRITAVTGSGQRLPCEIDQITGTIKLPASASYAGIKNREEAKNRKEQLVQRFEMTFFVHPDDPIVVAQRQGRTNQYR